MNFETFCEGSLIKDKDGKVINSQDGLIQMAQAYGEQMSKMGYLRGMAVMVEIADRAYMDTQKKIFGTEEKAKTE